MNCKEGDLAIVIRNHNGHTGTVLRCVKLHPETIIGATWITDQTRVNLVGKSSNLWFDRDLRPLRDNPGEDESLTWCPRKEPVPA